MVTYPTSDTATNIVNKVAAEVGLVPVADPYASNDQNFIQMQFLLNAAGEEILRMDDWQVLVREETFTTAAIDVGNYPLPADYTSMINQTMWDRTDDEPIWGPLSASEWALLKGQDTVTLADLYYRIKDGELWLYPNPVGVVRDVAYEYMSRYWVINTDAITYQADVVTGSDSPIFDGLLMRKYLKLKWLEAKGLDATAAQEDFNQIFNILIGQDKSAPILDAGGPRRYPFLNGYANVRDTGYGGQVSQPKS